MDDRTWELPSNRGWVTLRASALECGWTSDLWSFFLHGTDLDGGVLAPGRPGFAAKSMAVRVPVEGFLDLLLSFRQWLDHGQADFEAEVRGHDGHPVVRVAIGDGQRLQRHRDHPVATVSILRSAFTTTAEYVVDQSCIQVAADELEAAI
jgi:hypothetical protein